MSAPVVTGIVAAGTSLITNPKLLGANAQQVVGTCTSLANGVQLPTLSTTTQALGGGLGSDITITNSGVYPCYVYPQAAGTINALLAGVAQSIAAGQSQRFVATTNLNWVTMMPIIPGVIQLTAVQVIGTYVALPVDSGSTYLIPLVGQAGAITLPTSFPGAQYTFVRTYVEANAIVISKAIPGDLISGFALPSDIAAATSGAISAAGANSATFVASGQSGDKLTFIGVLSGGSGQGATWNVLGQCATHTKITIP